VALNWVTKRPGVVSSIIGASKLNQLEDNIHALEFDIPGELLVKLEEASALPVQYPYFFHEGDLNKNVNSQTNVRRQPSWYPKR
jgi:diketogulonate reductase-like aldo/keto reductase